MLRCDRLHRRYGRLTALHGLDLDIEPGHIAGLLGLNGAGKTTALHAIVTLLPPTSGDVIISGDSALHHPRAARRHLGFLPESNDVLLPAWTPWEILHLFAASYDLSRDEANARIAALVEELEYKEHLHRPLRVLSGGTKRKAQLSRALLHDPALVVLDEPTRELDIPTKRRVWAALRRRADEGAAILIASHDPLEIERLCDSVTVLREGHVVYQGPTEEATRATTAADVEEALAMLLTGRDVA